MEEKKFDRPEQARRGTRWVVTTCYHNVDPNVKLSVKEHDIPVVFSAPNRLGKLRAKVNKCSTAIAVKKAAHK